MDNESVEVNESSEKLVSAELPEKDAETSNSSEAFLTKFIAKTKKDPVMGICIAAIVLCLAGAILYFVIPTFYVESFDVTVDEFRTRYTQTSLYSHDLDLYNFAIPPVEFYEKQTEGTGIALTADPSLSNPNAYKNNGPQTHERYFCANIDTTATSLMTGIKGRCRSVDGELTEVTVFVQYDQCQEFYTFTRVYFATYLQALDPTLSDSDALALAVDAIYVKNSDEYMTTGNIAFRTYTCNENGTACLAMEIVPLEAAA